jgi:hypothetical protein
MADGHARNIYEARLTRAMFAVGPDGPKIQPATP